jgi:hypothetical protein
MKTAKELVEEREKAVAELFAINRTRADLICKIEMLTRSICSAVKNERRFFDRDAILADEVGIGG